MRPCSGAILPGRRRAVFVLAAAALALALALAPGAALFQAGSIPSPSLDGGWQPENLPVFLSDAWAHVLSALLTDAGKITDTGSLELDGAIGIATFEASDGTNTNTYAAVAAYIDDGVQVLKLTDGDTLLANPSDAGKIVDTTSLELAGAWAIAIFEASDGTNTNTYAAVAATDDDGVQVLRLTDGDTIRSNPQAAGKIGNTTSIKLAGVEGIAIFEASDGTNTNTYAAVASRLDDGVQILKLTDGDTIRSNPQAAGKIGDGDKDGLRLDGAVGIAIFEATKDGSTNKYAAVAAVGDDGVQVLKLTDGDTIRSNPSDAGKLGDTTSLELDGARGIAIFEVSDGTNTNTHAAVAAAGDDGVQVLRLTTGAGILETNPRDAGNIGDDESLELDGAWAIATFEVSDGTNTSTYAAVAAWEDYGVQVLRLTDGGTVLTDPADAGNIADDESLALAESWGISIFEASKDGSTDKYAAVTAWSDGGVQILKMDFPNSPPVLADAPTITVDGTVTTSTAIGKGSAVSMQWTATDADGDTISYEWSHDRTDLLDQFSSTTDTVEFTVPPDLDADATLTVTLAATDQHGDTASGTLVLSLKKDLIVADAGNDRTVAPYAAVTLDASASTVTDATTFAWSQTSGTPLVALSETDTASPWFLAPEVDAPVDLVFTLSLAEGGSTIVTDTVTVTVDPGAFGTTWEMPAGDLVLTLPVSGAGMTIDWGDGSPGEAATGPADHAYDTAGTYSVSVSGGLQRFHLDGHQDAPKLKAVDWWGAAQWTSMEDAFRGASSMEYGAPDAPDLSGVADMSGMFEGASSFDQPLNSWNVSSVTDMRFMFSGASSFDQPLNAWDVSSVIRMDRMFQDASSFDQPLNSWDVSSVTDMTRMFQSADSFDQPLNSWDVSSVTDMHNMFNHASSFDQPLNAWDVSRVTDMNLMFQDASSFDQPLNDWDVSSVTAMYSMFRGASSFDQPLNSWDVSRVTNMHNMFSDASSFDQPLNDWDVSSVIRMDRMFSGATAFNQNLGKWYIVLDDTGISDDGETLAIRAQNSFLEGQDPSYATRTPGFAVTGNDMLGLDAEDPADPGTRTVRIITTDGNTIFGASNFADVEVSVNARPAVDAGPDRTVAGGSTVTLGGAGSDPEGAVTLQWSQSAGPGVDLSGASTRAPAFTAPAGPAVLVFALTVTDSEGATASDSVRVTVYAVTGPPAADAGPDQVAQEGATVILEGSASDPDGDDLEYRWTHNGPASIVLSGADSRTAHFTAPQVNRDLYVTFTLEASGGGQRDSDTVLVIVRDRPAQHQGNTAPSLTLPGGPYVQLMRGGTHAGPSCHDAEDGPITGISSTGAVDTGTPGTYTVTYTCTDSGGLSDSASQTVVVHQYRAALTVNPPSPAILDVGDAYADPGATCEFPDGSSRPAVQTRSTVDTSRPGTYLVSYACSGPEGEVLAAESRRVIVKSPGADLAPVIHPPSPVTITAGQTWTDPGITCTDDLDPDPVVRVVASNLDVSRPGEYRVFYTCTDDAGNGATAVRTVTVAPRQ